MNIYDNHDKGEKDMAVLVGDVKKISEIVYLTNKIQLIKLRIVDELGKINIKEKKCKADPNLIAESLMIGYYTSNIDKRIEMAEESILLAYEAEKTLKGHTFK